MSGPLFGTIFFHHSWLRNTGPPLYVQPHLLGLVLAKFMIGTVSSTAEKWASYLRGNAAVETLGAEVSKYLDAVPEDFFF